MTLVHTAWLHVHLNAVLANNVHVYRNSEADLLQHLLHIVCS